MSPHAPYSVYAPDSARASRRSVSIFSRSRGDDHEDERPEVPKLPPPQSRSRSRAFGQGKRLSYVKVSLDGSVLHSVPENASLASIEAAMATFPREEILTAIGRSQSLRPKASAPNSGRSTYEPNSKGHGRNASEPPPVSKDSTRRRSSTHISNVDSVRRSGSNAQEGRVSALRSKFAFEPPLRDQRPQKPVVRLKIPPLAPIPPLKPLRSIKTRDLPPLPVEEAAEEPVEESVERDSQTPCSAISSLAMVLDDSNLILHHSVTSPLLQGHSTPDLLQPPESSEHASDATTSTPPANETSQDLPYTSTLHISPDLKAVDDDAGASPDEPAKIVESKIEPSGAITESVVNSEIPSEDMKNDNKLLKTFFSAESDSEDEPEVPEASPQSSGKSSISSYDVPTPPDPQVADATSKPCERFSLKDPVANGVFDATPSTTMIASNSNEDVSNSQQEALSHNFAESHVLPYEEVLAPRRSDRKWSKAAGDGERQLSIATAYSGNTTSCGPTPPLPRRSFKRHWQQSVRARNFSRPLLSRRSTEPASKFMDDSQKAFKRRNSDEFTHNRLNLILMAERRVSSRILSISEEMINPDVAESVVFQILGGLDSFEDLFACAMTNKGFYSVYKRNELTLLRMVLRNSSPAAWELRETSPKQIIARPETPGPEYTPTTYRQFQKRDIYVIESLKSLILSRCQSFLRADTVKALRGYDEARSNQIDNAFWRVWTFCLLFGSGKGREDDVVGQIDWLRGGALAHQATCSSTIVWSEPIDMTSILLNPPESFGKGNNDGLSTEELHDMTEIWNCLKALLYGILGEGRVSQAKENGVFKGLDVEDDDEPGQETLLEEWLYHLTTLGLSSVLDLTTASTKSDPEVFEIAHQMGWTNWEPLSHGGSRSTFLKEAVARVYEEKLLRSRTPDSDSEEDEQLRLKQYRKLRSAIVAAELKETKKITDYSKAPISEDRPMSIWSRVDQTSVEKGGFTAIEEEIDINSPNEMIHPAFREDDGKPKRTPTRSSQKSGRSARKKSQQAKRAASSKNEQEIRRPPVPSKDPSRPPVPAASAEVAPKPAHKPSKHTRSSLSTPKSTRKQDDAAPRTSSVLLSPFSLFPSPSRATKPTQGSGDRTPKGLRSASLRSKRPTIRFPSINRRSYYGVQNNVVGEASHDKALFRIVEMGFTVEQAREALKVTDLGHRLDADGAVQWLLNQRN